MAPGKSPAASHSFAPNEVCASREPSSSGKTQEDFLHETQGKEAAVLVQLLSTPLNHLEGRERPSAQGLHKLGRLVVVLLLTHLERCFICTEETGTELPGQ